MSFRVAGRVILLPLDIARKAVFPFFPILMQN